MKMIGEERYFEVKFPNRIVWLSNQKMKTLYPNELIEYYEQFVTIT